MATKPMYYDDSAGGVQVGGAVRVTAFAGDGSLPADVDIIAAVDTTSGSLNLTLPSPTGIAGRQYLIQKTIAIAGKITLVRTGGEKINGVASTYDLPNSNDPVIMRFHVWTNGTDWWAQ